LLELRDLSVAYGGVSAVRGISLHVNAGEAVCLIGANGAGKTSTLRAISGLKRPAAGAITFEGRDIVGMRAAAIVQRGISHVPEGRRVFPRLSVADNLELGAYREPAAVVASRTEKMYDLFPVLAERRAQLAATLSGGEQQMLAVARAMMAGPRLLLLDEPSLGLAPLVVRALFLALQRVRDSGVTMLVVEQNAHLALEFVQRAYVLERGRVTCSGQARDVECAQRVVQNDLSHGVRSAAHA
jgi:branched-chain amino acid transport system ATP-binding protein